MMQLVTVGVDYTTAPLDVRERFALSGAALERALGQLREVAGEGLILSTCNRTEYYALVDCPEAGRRALAAQLLDVASLHGPVSDAVLSTEVGEAAVHRLFGIASGTRSMVTGESDILRQLKVALATARDAGAAGPSILRLGTAALAVGKRVRQTTEIGRRRASVVSVALDQARASLDDGRLPNIVIVGAGETADRALQYIARPCFGGTADVTLIGRRVEVVRDLAGRTGATPGAWDGLAAALQQADMVVCCTSAPGYVIDPRMVLDAQRSRRHAPLLLVDLASPRDIDPMARNIGGVTLIDLDEVEQLAREDDTRHRAALAAADIVITEHVARYMTWWQNRCVAPTIAAFVSRSNALRDAELRRTLAQLPGLSAPEIRAVQQLASRLTNKLMHSPLAALNGHPDAAMVDALHRLFALPSGTMAPADADSTTPAGQAILLPTRPPLTATDRSTR